MRGYMMKNMMDNFVKQINNKYMEAISELDKYIELILATSDYELDDILVLTSERSNANHYQIVLCPKSCFIEGYGILPCEYFLGIKEEYHDGFFMGWSVIDEIPEDMYLEMGKL